MNKQTILLAPAFWINPAEPNDGNGSQLVLYWNGPPPKHSTVPQTAPNLHSPPVGNLNSKEININKTYN